MIEDRTHDDPHEIADMCEDAYARGYCYDCGKLNCEERH